VIMVGELRNRDTAEIAIQAAITGHPVLSTLHTNDSAGTITRLLDMGVEPYLVSSAVSGVKAQRLVRTICPACKTLYYASAPLKEQLGGPAEQNLQLARGRGRDSSKSPRSVAAPYTPLSPNGDAHQGGHREISGTIIARPLQFMIITIASTTTFPIQGLLALQLPARVWGEE
jgi:hypothetical protein